MSKPQDIASPVQSLPKYNDRYKKREETWDRSRLKRMTKTKQSKLSLARETLRNLKATNLQAVGGGMMPGTTCTAYDTYCGGCHTARPCITG